MPATVIGSHFYTAQEAAHDFGLPIEQVEKFFAEIVSEGIEPVAYYQGPCVVMLSGYTISRRLLGQRQPPQYMPTRWTRRR